MRSGAPCGPSARIMAIVPARSTRNVRAVFLCVITASPEGPPLRTRLGGTRGGRFPTSEARPQQHALEREEVRPLLAELTRQPLAVRGDEVVVAVAELSLVFGQRRALRPLRHV